jgi:hypothetical protein
MLYCGFWEIKPCGQMSKGRKRAKGQRLDGQIQSIGGGRAIQSRNRLAAPSVVKPTYLSSMLTKMVEEQIVFVENVINNSAKKDGMLGLGWIGGLLGITCMV